jgi:hypothetical protein
MAAFRSCTHCSPTRSAWLFAIGFGGGGCRSASAKRHAALSFEVVVSIHARL